MATDQLKPEPTLKGRGATSPLEGLVHLLARQAAREAVAVELIKSQPETNPVVVAPSAEREDSHGGDHYPRGQGQY